MSQRTGKGPRLWLQPERQEKGGRIRQASWIIRDDGSIFIRTGCIREDRKGAERALQEYIASKYKVSRDHSRSPAEILVVDVLNIYIADQQRLGKQSPIKLKQVGHRALRLAEYWNGKTLADVNGNSCRAYVAWRVGQQWKSSRPESTGNAPATCRHCCSPARTSRLESCHQSSSSRRSVLRNRFGGAARKAQVTRAMAHPR